jgi:hypothetical protein
MRRAALLPFDVTKEIRGLAGAWLACLTALVLPAAMGVRAIRGLEIRRTSWGLRRSARCRSATSTGTGR